MASLCVTRSHIFFCPLVFPAFSSVPLCRISGVVESEQWKTDLQASSCHSSVLPTAFLRKKKTKLFSPIPQCSWNHISAAFPWFSAHMLRACISGKQTAGLVVSAEFQVPAGERLSFVFALRLTPIWLTQSPVCSSCSCGDAPSARLGRVAVFLFAFCFVSVCHFSGFVCYDLREIEAVKILFWCKI